MNYDTVAGCLFGMAFGDALGAKTEFLSMDDIRMRYPLAGPTAPVGKFSTVTDDTQMAIAVGNALLAVKPDYQNVTKLEAELRQAYITWYHDPENNRAPGMTCLTSIERLIKNNHWQTATNIGSKGCGANMRVQAVGLLDVDATLRSAIAQFQAALTHAHPTALAASELTAFVIADLAQNGDVETLIARIRTYIMKQRENYHADWLGDVWQQAFLTDTP